MKPIYLLAYGCLGFIVVVSCLFCVYLLGKIL